MNRSLKEKRIECLENEIRLLTRRLAEKENVIRDFEEFLFKPQKRRYSYPALCLGCGVHVKKRLRRNLCPACYNRFWRRRRPAPLGSQEVTHILRKYLVDEK